MQPSPTRAVHGHRTSVEPSQPFGGFGNAPSMVRDVLRCRCSVGRPAAANFASERQSRKPELGTALPAIVRAGEPHRRAIRKPGSRGTAQPRPDNGLPRPGQLTMASCPIMRSTYSSWNFELWSRLSPFGGRRRTPAIPTPSSKILVGSGTEPRVWGPAAKNSY